MVDHTRKLQEARHREDKQFQQLNMVVFIVFWGMIFSVLLVAFGLLKDMLG